MALTSDNCAWIASNRLWMALPKNLTDTETNGRGINENRVSRGSMEIISARATTNPSSVFAEYITAGPTIWRTAFKSFVARDIRSPVRRAWKYDAGIFSSCAKKSLRMSYSMWRDAPIRIRRIRKRKTPPTTPSPSSAEPYKASFPRVTPVVRSSMASFSTQGAVSAMPVVPTTQASPRRKSRR